MSLVKCNSINDLSTKEFLSSLIGSSVDVKVEPMKTSGFSGSTHERIIAYDGSTPMRSFVLKRISPKKDMTVWRTGHIANRELRLLQSNELKIVWKIIESPYVAFANDGDITGLLMYDLSSNLFPDVREPITIEQENIILRTLTRLHAQFWNKPLQSATWLANDRMFIDFLGPTSAEEEKNCGREHPIFNAVQSGWNVAFQLMPAELKSFILEPSVDHLLKGLPKTLIHGDSKLANFAIIRDDRITAFDWTVTGYASSAVELGWYLAVNASRLARPKEKFIQAYREYLQQELGTDISNDEWDAMVRVAIITGIRMLLWNKALNFQKQIAGAKEEWQWWIERIAESK